MAKEALKKNIKQLPKVLLILNGVNTDSVGEQFVKSMLKDYPRELIYRYSFVYSDVNTNPSIHNYHIRTSHQSYYSLPLINSLCYWIFKKRRLNTCVEEVLTIVRDNGIKLVWSFIDSPFNISLMSSLQEDLKIPYVAHVWDTPEQLAVTARFDYLTKKTIFNAFDRLMRSANVTISVSDYMQKMYEREYCNPSYKMILSPDSSCILPFNRRKQETEIIKIVFAGSLYAYKPWNALLRAIKYRNEANSARKLKLICLGHVSRFAEKPDWVDFRGYLPMNEAAQIVNQADIAYLPYWMESTHSYFVKTAFPGKMTFYTAASTPILYHGPEDSSPNDFLKKHKVGLTCSSLKIQEILSHIDDLQSSKFLNNYENERSWLMDNTFSLDASSKLFQKIINKIKNDIPK